MKMVISSLIFFAISSASLTSVDLAQSTVLDPPGMASISSVPGAMDSVYQLIPQPEKDLISIFITQDQLRRSPPIDAIFDSQWVFVIQGRPSTLNPGDELSFQQLAYGVRQRTLESSTDRHPINEDESDSTGIVSDRTSGVLIIDESDCVARYSSYELKLKHGVLTMDMLTAYVRIDGIIYTVYAAANKKEGRGKEWLKNDVVPWLRKLPTDKNQKPLYDGDCPLQACPVQMIPEQTDK